MSDRRLTYPLLPFSQLVYDTTRWLPRRFCRYVITIRVKGIEKGMAEDVFRKVLENHPVFCSNINWRGRQYAIKVRDIFRGKYHEFSIWEKNDYLYMKMEINGVIGDNKSVYVLTEDIINAYLGIPLAQDDYWGYIKRHEQRKLESHYLQSKKWLIQEFENIDAPIHPKIDRHCYETIFPYKVGLLAVEFTQSLSKIKSFTRSSHLSVDGLFVVCTGLAIAEYCDSDEAALTWAYDGRETLEEQHIFGGLHRDVPFKISRKSKVESQKSASREELIREARNQIRSGIAHSDYPYTLTSPYSKRWNNAVNVLRVTNIENILELVPVPFEVVTIPTLRYTFALLDVEIVEGAASLYIRFRYSATHYKESSIRRFADLIRKYAEWLMEE